MAALAGNRNTQRQGDEGPRQVYPLADNVIVYMGSIVVLNAGLAEPGQVAVGLEAVGVASLAYPNGVSGGPGTPGNYADNTQPGHAAGKVAVECRRGIWKFDNCGSDLVVVGDIGKPCFVFDDHTVAHSDGSAARSVAGRVEQIDADGGIWVNFNIQAALAS
jgi:hypothetical protein